MALSKRLKEIFVRIKASRDADGLYLPHSEIDIKAHAKKLGIRLTDKDSLALTMTDEWDAEKKATLLYGALEEKRYDKPCQLKEIVGKTVKAVSRTEVDSDYTPGVCIVLHFEDGTHHGFVVPNED